MATGKGGKNGRSVKCYPQNEQFSGENINGKGDIVNIIIHTLWTGRLPVEIPTTKVHL
jgi:hypothetical protein